MLLSRGPGLGCVLRVSAIRSIPRWPVWALLGLLAGAAMGCKYPALDLGGHSVCGPRIDSCLAESLARSDCCAYAGRMGDRDGPVAGQERDRHGQPGLSARESLFHGRSLGPGREKRSGLPYMAAERSRSTSWQTRWSTSPAGLTGSRRSTWHWLRWHSFGRARAGSQPGALGLRGLSVSHLVALDPPAGPILAAPFAAAGGPRGAGGRLGQKPRLVDPSRCDSSTIALAHQPDLHLDGAGGPERMDRRPRLPAARYSKTLERAPGTARRRAARGLARPLLVGQAAVFHLDHSIIYNTVFNPETIEILASGKSDDEFREALQAAWTDPHLRRLERDRAPSPAGRLWFHRLRDPSAFGRLGGGRACSDPPLSLGADQELYQIAESNQNRRDNLYHIISCGSTWTI